MLANIKALDLCVCGCMYTHAITLTQHTSMHTNYCENYQRYLTAIRTYFTRWLIRTNSYDLTRTISKICLNPTDG